MSRTFRVVIIAGLLAGSAMPLHSQEPEPVAEAPVTLFAAARRASTISPEDSVEFLRAARSDQASFERIRRRHLPETWGGGSVRCDERVGRFCLTHGDEYDEWIAPPEDAEVVAARGQLVDGLTQVAELMPGDNWIAGQLVRYLIESRRFDGALEAARHCQGDAWWCAALTGFVLHARGREAGADSAFAAALDAMDEDMRAEWTDLSLILADPTVRAYRRMNPEERVQFERRFWRLADPLFTRPGNALRSEHFARHVWDRLQIDAEVTDGLSWGYDLREIVIRYGWPSGWERTREWGPTLQSSRPPLVSHYGSAPQYLLPPPESLLDGNGTEGEWEADLPRARTGYDLALRDSVADWFSPLYHQFALFPRRDEAIVVAGYELPADSIDADARITAGLAALTTTGPDAEPKIVTRETDRTSGALMISVPLQPAVVSLEIAIPEQRRLARARHGVDLAPIPPGLISLSDLLLLTGGGDPESLPDSLAAAVQIARPSTRVHAGESIGVYWEIYGLDPTRTPTLSMSLRVLEGRKGWLRRLAERAGLVDDAAPVRLRWEEPATGDEYMARSIGLQIPQVEPGEYTLELTVEAPGREPLSIRKDIQVLPG